MMAAFAAVATSWASRLANTRYRLSPPISNRSSSRSACCIRWSPIGRTIEPQRDAAQSQPAPGWGIRLTAEKNLFMVLFATARPSVPAGDLLTCGGAAHFFKWGLNNRVQLSWAFQASVEEGSADADGGFAEQGRRLFRRPPAPGKSFGGFTRHGKAQGFSTGTMNSGAWRARFGRWPTRPRRSRGCEVTNLLRSVTSTSDAFP